MTSPRKLTVALVFATPGTGWGGMEKHTKEFAEALANRGHTVHVIGHKSYRHRFSEGVNFHSVPVQLGRRNPWLHFALKCLIHQLTPDILHAQGNKAAQLIGHIKPAAGAVRVGTVHGSKSSHRGFQRLDRIIAVSQHIYDHLGYPNKQLIFNGIEPPPEKNPASESTPILPTNATNVIAVGRLEPVKGFATLIRAWAELSQHGINAHLSIFGDGSLQAELQELVTSLGLNGQVTLAGFHASLTSVYRQADLLAISSEREGFPYVLIESLLAGCPVVSTPVSGPASLLPQRALSQDYEVASLARLLADSLADLPALKQAERSAMAFAEEKLTLECMTNETERLYFDALATKDGQDK